MRNHESRVYRAILKLGLLVLMTILLIGCREPMVEPPATGSVDDHNHELIAMADTFPVWHQKPDGTYMTINLSAQGVRQHLINHPGDWTHPRVCGLLQLPCD